MYIDRNEIAEYPFDGKFYYMAIDETKPPSEWVEEEIVVFETKCDIQESSKTKSSSNGFISASYNVYFPFDKIEGININKGLLFKGSMYNMEVKGEVIGIYPSQLGGCQVSIKDLE